MKTIIIVFYILILSAPVYATDKELIWQILNIADYVLTEKVLDQGGYEKNPLIGEHPSDIELVAWCAAFGIGHYLITKSLPERWRNIWQNITIPIAGGLVINNALIIKW